MRELTISIISLSSQEVSRQLDDLQSVYEAMYGMPRGSASGFDSMVTEHSRREGFRLCAAFDEKSDRLVGFAYGFTGYPGQPWRDSLASAMGPEAAKLWLIGHFEFAEFGVISRVRRRGIGTRLCRTLFSDLPHSRAVLTVREANEPARRFYEKRNWIVLHQGFFAQSGRGPYVVMGKVL
jgi:ribosomal protein S18 acetylase RimI-like enzyme